MSFNEPLIDTVTSGPEPAAQAPPLHHTAANARISMLPTFLLFIVVPLSQSHSTPS
jgi:hypothetical protein